MADIRATGQLDDFNRPNEAVIQLPWLVGFATTDPELYNKTLHGTAFPPVSCEAVWGASAYSRNCETWGRMSGSAAEVDGWRLGMFTVASVIQAQLGAGGIDGYECLPHNPIGGPSWILRRYDNGSIHSFGGTSGVGLGGLALMRLVGTQYQVWRSTDNGANWTNVWDIADSTYTGPFYFMYGTTGVDTGWSGVGGGAIKRTQIYRYVTN